MLQAALEIDGEWMSYLLRPGRTYLHHKATTSFWHLEGIVREKAKDWTNRDADESLTPRQASAGEVAWTMAPYHFLTPTKKACDLSQGMLSAWVHMVRVQAWALTRLASSLLTCSTEARPSYWPLFPKHCWTVQDEMLLFSSSNPKLWWTLIWSCWSKEMPWADTMNFIHVTSLWH